MDQEQPGTTRQLYKIVLENERSLSMTDHHKVPTLDDEGMLTEKRAEQLKSGDILACVDKSGNTERIPIVNISTYVTTSGVGNFVIRGFPIANGIMSSVRVKGDGPDLMWDAGYQLYQTCGPRAANIYSNVGYMFIDRNIVKTMLYLLLLFILFCTWAAH